MIVTPQYRVPEILTILSQKNLDGDNEPWRKQLDAVTGDEVERAMSQAPGCYTFEKLVALVSPAAQDYLEEMAQIAHRLTVQRFGRTIRLYGPLYLSNFCINSCRYCGFNNTTSFERTRLTVDQALREADIIASEGFSDILLVSSEDRGFVSIDYLAELAGKLRQKFSFISIEVYGMTAQEYHRLFEAGIEGVTLYQETYNRRAYQYYHPAGPKADYDNRLTTPDRMAAAGMREIGLGALLGLTDWRTETLALAEHAHYLIKRYWRSHVSFSFPRLRPAFDVDSSQFQNLLTDKDLAQMITALRLCFADAGLVLSTRERAALRDNLIKLGITKMSAGSKTNPGGYSGCIDSIRQFEVDDSRSPAQVAAMIKQQGFDPVWKDWDAIFNA
ncbi:MAG TPA: 2-iminoacetate synthase ThiH [Sedimentisphaerales bacterium]|nr:2-iminoacetate synthase ThiH [Sedimentisphaerales bacterium]